jgi:secondary thiamine-phosphate synthase enzyme
METVLDRHPQSVWHHLELRVTSDFPTQFIDLTERLDRIVAAAAIRTGLLTVQTRHTTTAIVINEPEPLLMIDFAQLFEEIAPSSRAYRHDSGARVVNLTPHERTNGHAHCRALLLPTTACLTIAHGRIQLGRWQKVLFVELDGPQERSVSTVLVGDSR